MNHVYAVLITLGVPLFFAFSVLAYLRAVTRRLLTDMCGADERAEYWMRVSAILVLAAPLALVLMFGHAPVPCQGGGGLPVADMLRSAASWSLVGILLAVGAVSRGIARHIPRGAGRPVAGFPGGGS